MRVRIQGKAVELTDADQIGIGGEATVYALGPGEVAKVYHSGVELKTKEAKVTDFPTDLPLEVVRPLNPILDSKSKFVGYTMERVPLMAEFLRLGQRAWRDQYPTKSASICTLFNVLSEVTYELHSKKIVVGDFNDGNVLFDLKLGRVRLIDTDSFQFGRFPCEVAHERFLDPHLYGLDLAARPSFTNDTDWYALHVMLFASLLCVHPYGGVAKGYPTLLRRAEARHSILRPDVKWPKSAFDRMTLSDDLLHRFGLVFDANARGPIPKALLVQNWNACSCGTEHQRRICPVCAVASFVPAVRHQGKCKAIEILKLKSGRIVHCDYFGDRLTYTIERSDGQLEHENGRIEAPRPRIPGFGLYESQCFRIDTSRNAIINTALETRVANVLPGQTWFRSGTDLAFGFYRVGKVAFYFLHRIGQSGSISVELPQPEGKILDASAVFDTDYVLFGMSVEVSGRAENRFFLVRRDGTLIASVSGPPDSSKVLESIHGKCLSRGRIVASTDEGLMAVKAENGVLSDGTIFTDTEPWVALGDRLVTGSGGSIYVVKTDSITKLTLG